MAPKERKKGGRQVAHRAANQQIARGAHAPLTLVDATRLYATATAANHAMRPLNEIARILHILLYT